MIWPSPNLAVLPSNAHGKEGGRASIKTHVQDCLPAHPAWAKMILRMGQLWLTGEYSAYSEASIRAWIFMPPDAFNVFLTTS